MSFELVDAHAHLQHPAFALDLEELLRRAGLAGVSRVLSAGTRPGDWPPLLALARGRRGVFPFFGLHPWFAAEADGDWLQELEACLVSVPSGVGEIGLDETRGGLDVQIPLFDAQLGLARRRGLPVTVHCVRAWGPMMEALRKAGPLEAGVLFHAFAGPAELLPALTELGGYFSFSAAALTRGGPRLGKTLRAVPPGRLLLETDCPKRSGRGEPSDLQRALAAAALLLGAEEELLARRLMDNARRFLGRLW